ncbi:uncharacterized protein ACA1_203940 [Acanthamoeba castellanii str. Neff]|uniref:Uncharacterized protein n=1 Tax=Acanthamoeba castellanii (strain ATCC 30010 / Neff) TaxID=1257118 RepID=L8GT07_ACACF|nr:uncharacterized protein ACA1_203940 [Acanthamoeba castellanii str. Neff]ELR16339.1 hypothetical protein ACA1_203940 [Acanthamoeba castellanii str. Neff]
MKFAFNAWGRTLALAGGYRTAVGVLIYLFLYPLKLGSWWLGPILWIVNFNHLPLGIALILLGPFCSVVVPTVLAGVTIVLAGLFYVVAGIRREKGTPLKELMWNCGDDPKSKGGRE